MHKSPILTLTNTHRKFRKNENKKYDSAVMRVAMKVEKVNKNDIIY